jgi:lysozyme
LVIGLQPKLDPVGIWTVGYGHAVKVNGEFLRGISNKAKAYELFPCLTEQEACDLLNHDLDYFENFVSDLNVDLQQFQFDSLVSFAYNVGTGSLYRSTLLKVVRYTPNDEKAIERSFMMWNKGRIKGKLTVLPGLVRRRLSEAYLFNAGGLKFYF